MKIIVLILISIVSGISQDWVIPLSDIKGDIIVKVENEKEFIIYKEKNQIVLFSDNKKKYVNGIDSLLPFDKGRYIAKKNKLWGLFDIDKYDFIIPPVYEKIAPVKGINAFKVEKYGGSAIVNLKNKIIVPYSANDYLFKSINLIELNDSVFTYLWTQKRHFAPVKPAFDNNNEPQNIIVFPNGNMCIKYADSEVWQLLDKKNVLIGKINRNIKFDKLCRNFCIIKDNKLFGAMDFNGKMIVPISKKSKSAPSLKLLIDIDKRGKDIFRKIIDQNIFEHDFENYSYVSESFYKVKIDKRYALYDIVSDVIIADSINLAIPMQNRLIVTKKDSCLLFDKSGNLIKSIFGKFYRKISFDRFIVTKDKEKALFDKSGNIVFGFAKRYFSGKNKVFISISENGKPLKYLDCKNREVDASKLNFKVIRKMKNKLIIEKLGKYGVVDFELNEVVPVIYDYLGKASRNLIVLGLNGKKGVVRI